MLAVFNRPRQDTVQENTRVGVGGSRSQVSPVPEAAQLKSSYPSSGTGEVCKCCRGMTFPEDTGTNVSSLRLSTNDRAFQPSLGSG